MVEKTLWIALAAKILRITSHTTAWPGEFTALILTMVMDQWYSWKIDYSKINVIFLLMNIKSLYIYL